MELDLLFSSGTLGDVVPFGAIAIALLFTVRNQSGTSTGSSTSNLVYTDPIFFLQVCAGIIRQIAQPTSKVDSKENIPTPLLTEEPTHSIQIISERDAEHEAFLSELTQGLKNYPPELCAEGTNGTYFLRDASGDVKAVFKPTDEEGDSPNNPKEHARDVDRGIRPGEAAIREVIAYRLDQRLDNIFRVPPTLLVNMTHPNFVDEEGKRKTKTGSLQYFVPSQGCAADIGPRSFPIEEVHRIAALDMMIYNTDRHDGNILYNREEGLTLTPIDHGFSLPDKFGAGWFDWMYYPQASSTFTPLLTSKISSFDVHQFARDISHEFEVREECLMTMVLSTTILQTGLNMGKTPKQLAQFLSRARPHEKSPVEEMMSQVEDMDGDLMFNVQETLAQKLSAL